MKKEIQKIILSVSILGILFGVLTISLHLFNNSFESLAIYLSAYGKWLIYTPEMFEMLNIFVGTTIIIVSAFFILYSIYQRRIDYRIEKSYPYILFFIVVFLSLIILLTSINKPFNQDEFEHIHSAWYIKNNYAPYSDFFQNHHPLLWLSIVPFLFILDNSVETIMVLRLVMFILTLGIAFSAYLIAKKITKSKEIALLSVILLLSMGIFIVSGVEIRPDVPQVLFGLISIYYLINFLQSNDNKYMIFAGLSASISFLFLQKTTFLLIAYTMIFIFQLLKREISIKSILYFIICFSLPLLFFFGYLIKSESFFVYILTNWLLNMQPVGSSSPFGTLKFSLIQNGLFWLFSTISIGFVLLSKKVNNELKTVTFIGLVLLSLLFLVNSTSRQDFMLAIPLLSIAAAYFLKFSCDRIKLNDTYKVLLIILIIIVPVFSLLALNITTNSPQLEKINFVLRNSKESDLIYDGNIKFNVYRYDLHYFWYCTGEKRCLSAYNKLTNNKYGDYDICELIKSKEPIFISDYELNITECGLGKLYNKTKYDDLYIRKDKIKKASRCGVFPR